jgi:uncharacterized protein (DUF3820 family)
MPSKTPANQPAGFDSENPGLGFDTEDLCKLAQWKMPFGKYQGRVLVDLPEAYLLWFQQHEFPDGKLGELMKLCLMLKIDGLDGLLKPMVRSGTERKK